MPDPLILLSTRGFHVLVLSRQNRGAAIDAAEGLGDDGRAVCADGCTNSHEETVKGCEQSFPNYRALCIPECRRRSHHVLSEGSQHAVWPRTEADDVCEA